MDRRDLCTVRRVVAAPVLLVVLAAQVGCGTKASMKVIQPGMRFPQDMLRLRSEWAFASDDQPGLERIVLMFPLPGAQAGDRQFFVYLRVPGKRAKPVLIGDPLPGGGRVGGFLIQTTGPLAGKTHFTKGRIRLRGSPFDGGDRRVGSLDLYCADGSVVVGEFTAVVSPLEVTDFEVARAGDVHALVEADGGPDAQGQGLQPKRDGAGR